MKTITITINDQGEAEIKTTGFKGSACSLATREIERALGKVTKDTKLPEFFQGNEQKVKATT